MTTHAPPPAAPSESQARFSLGPPRPAPRPLLVDQLDPMQRRAATSTARAVLAVGGAGTGKTTSLVAGVAAAVDSGTPLSAQLILGGSRPQAQSLRSAVVAALGSTQVAPPVTTMHAWCLGLLRRFGHPASDDPASPELTLLTAPEQEFRLRELLAGRVRDAWPDDLRAAAGTRTLASEVRTALAHIRQQGLDPGDVVHIGQRAARPEWILLGEFFEEYLDVLDAQHALDYAELVHRARLLLLQDEVRAALEREVRLVWLDDVGECDLSQLQLAADLVGLGASIRMFGDPHTTVFGFRGAHRRVFVDAGTLLAQPVERHDLSVSYRHGPDLAGALASLTIRLPVEGAAAPPAAGVSGPGRVEVVVAESPGAEAAHLAEVLRLAHRDEGLAWSQMAVITRSGRGALPVLQRQLSAAAIPVQVVGDQIALAEEVAVRPLLLLLETAAELCAGAALDPDRALLLLRGPLGGVDAVGVRRLGRALREQFRASLVHRCDHADAHAADATDDGAGPTGESPIGPTPAPGDGDAGSGTPASTQLVAAALRPGDRALDELPGGDAAAARSLRAVLATVIDLVNSGASPSAVLWAAWSSTRWPERLEHEALAGGDGAARAHRDLDAVCALFDLAARESGAVGLRGVRALLAEVESQQIPADHARESDPSDRGVHLTTAHRAKGQQWPLVVVAHVQEGEWPSVRRGTTVLSADRISRHGIESVEPWSQLVAEERRSFLLAASRASSHLVVSAVRGTEGEADQPSRFLAELGVEPRIVAGRPTRESTPEGLVAELRRHVVDPDVSPALREQAALRLARLGELRDHRGHPVAASAHPDRWWGMKEFSSPAPEEDPAPDEDPGAEAPGPAPTDTAPGIDPVWQVRGSELGTLLECPRQWFLSRRVRAEHPRGAASSLGSVIHVLAEHAQSGAVGAVELEDQLDRVWSQIPFEAAWLSPSERAEASAALERWAAWSQGVQRTVLATEVPFSTTIEVDSEPVDLVGVVDRLDLDSQGRLRIVDFKTGRRAPTAADVAESPQLGLYQLAALAGAFDHVAPGRREVGGAELVHLRVQDGSSAPWPKVLAQPSLLDHPHGSQPSTGRLTWVHDRLAAGLSTMRSGHYEARICGACAYCPFVSGCPARGHGKPVVP